MQNNSLLYVTQLSSKNVSHITVVEKNNAELRIFIYFFFFAKLCGFFVVFFCFFVKALSGTPNTFSLFHTGVKMEKLFQY